jgi:hypothetical protein
MIKWFKKKNKKAEAGADQDIEPFEAQVDEPEDTAAPAAAPEPPIPEPTAPLAEGEEVWQADLELASLSD